MLIKLLSSIRYLSCQGLALRGHNESADKPPTLPHPRKAARRYYSGQDPHRYCVPKDRYRHIFFESLEVVCGEVEQRFDQSDLHLAQEIECLLLPAANGNTDPVSKFIEGDIDKSRLSIKLPMVQDMIKTAMNGSIRKTTNPRSITQVMDKSNIYKNKLSEIDKPLKIYFTISITSATAKRGFSSLQRLKTFLCSTMSQSRLNELFCFTFTLT